MPIAQFFERKLRFPRSAAAGISVILFLVFIAIIIYAVGSQISSLARDWPLFKEQVTLTLHTFQQWVSDRFHIDLNKQLDYFNNATSKMLSASTAVIGTTVLTLSSIMLFLVFTMIDTFFLLFYRRLVMKFLVGVFREENSVIVYEIVAQIQYIIRKYITGLLLEMTVVAGVCCLAFWLLGIKYAVLLGIITGLFNIIPYIGIFTALLLSTLITFATGAVATKVLFVVITVIGMHLVDSNVLLPLIVGSKVRINALITLLAVIIGEMMWGISGMFLAIPVVAITKIIFDRIESLKPWGILLGDEKDEKQPGKLLKKIKSKSVPPPQIQS
ncbi:MAG: AI-2E family transporter [Chitinophagaceae bacterium]|nr:AI-2E family transporter [Chitinophagaceae bacterium]